MGNGNGTVTKWIAIALSVAVIIGSACLGYAGLRGQVTSQKEQMDRDRVELRAKVDGHYTQNTAAIKELRDTTAALAIEVARLRDSAARLERQVEILNRRTP